MEKKKLAVIFDTNSYRKIVNNKNLEDSIADISAIKQLENKKDIQAFGSIIVGMEMLGNLAEGENGFNYKDCLNGTILLAKHCNDESINQPRIIAHVPLLMEQSLFGSVKSARLEHDTQSMAGTIIDFRDDYQQAIAHHESVNTFENIKKYLDVKEEEFCTQIENLVDGAVSIIKQENPKADKKAFRTKTLELLRSSAFLNMMSMAVVKAIYINAGEDISEEELSKRGEFFRNTFPLAAGFYQWITIEVFDKNIDLRSKTSIQKRWNWQWDYHVSYAVSNSQINGRDIIIVTSDDDLTKIIHSVGFVGRVMTLEEYQIFLSDESA